MSKPIVNIDMAHPPCTGGGLIETEYVMATTFMLHLLQRFGAANSTNDSCFKVDNLPCTAGAQLASLTALPRVSSRASCSAFAPDLQLPPVFKAAFPFHTGGGLIGLAYGITTRFILRFLQRFGATAEQQIALTLACGYLSFYTANAPAHVSGVPCLLVFMLHS